MSQGGYSHTTRATGTVLTAAIYNSDHQAHITNQNPVMTGGYSDSLSQMQLTQDPGSLGTESLAATLAGEIERIRYQLRLITGETQWYVPPGANLKQVGGTVADSSIALTKLTNTTQGKIMGRTGAGVGAWQEFDIPTLTPLTPAPTDVVLGSALSGGAPRRIAVSDLTSVAAMTVPQGRLSLVTNTPVVWSNVNGSSTIFYVPFNGQQVPVWNGTQYTAANMGGQLTQLLNDTTKSPAAAAPDKVYDIFFWLDGTTPRISRGPAWTSETVRGTGANTSELTRLAGFLVNAQAITNGPAANRGTYLGTIRTNGVSTVHWIINNSTSGGSPCWLHVWNQYNRTDALGLNRDTGAEYNYTPAAYREIRGTGNMRIYFVIGQQEDRIETSYSSHFRGVNSNAFPKIAMGLDGSTVNIGSPLGLLTGSANASIIGAAVAQFGCPVGAHTLSALEAGDGTNANIYNRDANQLLSLVARM
jgi:hypothetical protein